MVSFWHMISGTLASLHTRLVYLQHVQLAVHVQLLPHGICNQLFAHSKGGAYQDLANVFADIPLLTKLKKKVSELNKQWTIVLTPNGDKWRPAIPS